MNRSARAALILCVGLVGTLVACDPEAEGCLDFRARTVDVTASVACDDCCAYPTLTLQWLPVRFAPDTVERLGRDDVAAFAGDTLSEPQLGFYLHDIALERADGSLYPLTDTLTVVGVVEGEDRALRDVSLVRVLPYRAANNELGTLLESVSVVALRASVGLPADLAGADVELQPTTSPLASDRDSLVASERLGLRAAGLRGRWSGAPDSVEVQIAGVGAEVRWALPASVDLARSEDLVLTLGFPVDALAQAAAEQITAGELTGGRFVELVVEPIRVIDATTR